MENYVSIKLISALVSEEIYQIQQGWCPVGHLFHFDYNVIPEGSRYAVSALNYVRRLEDRSSRKVKSEYKLVPCNIGSGDLENGHAIRLNAKSKVSSDNLLAVTEI